MKWRNPMLAVAAALLGFGVAATPAQAQPAWDVVHVTLPNPTLLGNLTMPAGTYKVEQLPGTDTVLAFFNANGMRFKTSAVTIRELDGPVPVTTSVILQRVGNQYYLSKLLISGKDGYEFQVPSGLSPQAEGNK